MVDGAVSARRAGTSTDRIVFLGHATVLIELDGVRLLTDPLLRRRVAHLRRQIAPVDRASCHSGPSDAVLISHMHHDHLDLPSLRLLGRDTPLLVPAGAGAWLRRRGFTRVTELGVRGETAMSARSPSQRSRLATMAAAARAPRPASRDAWLPRDGPAAHGLLRRRHGALRRACPISRRRSTSPSYRSGAGGRSSVRVTWIHSTPRARPRLIAAAPGHSDALGNAAADRPRRAPPGAARRPAAAVRRARRMACAGRRGTYPGAGAGNNAVIERVVRCPAAAAPSSARGTPRR